MPEQPNRGVVKSPRSLLLPLVLLNVILLGFFLYEKFGSGSFPSGGMSLAVINDTPDAMIDFVLEYPQGKMSFARLNAGQQVADRIKITKAFDAKITFKDESGHPYDVTVKLRPHEDLMALLYVKPVLEKTSLKTVDGKEETTLRWIPSKLRVSTAFQRPDLPE